jgi:hypothetical protein
MTALFLSLGLCLTACKKENKEEKLEAVITLSSATGTPGDTITLDAGNSQAPEGTSFSFEVSAGVNYMDFEIIATDDSKVKKLYCKKGGYYTVQLRLTHNGRFNETQTTITISGAKKISEDITTFTTLEKLNNFGETDYYVDRIIEVHQPLIISEFVRISFAQDAGFIVKEGGRIDMKNASSLEYAGSNEGEGWRGIYLEGGNLTVESGITIESAGYGTWSNGKSAAILVDGSRSISSSGSFLSFSKSGSHDVEMLTENGNLYNVYLTFSDNVAIAFKGFAKHLQYSGVFGNKENTFVEIQEGSVVFNNQIAHQCKFLFSGHVEINGNGQLSLGKVYVAAEKSIGISGEMTIQQTEFAGYEGTAWAGIVYTATQSELTLNDVGIKNAGFVPSGTGTISAAVTVAPNAGRLTIRNSRIENPHGYGVYSTKAIRLEGNTLSNCLTGGAKINFRSIIDHQSHNIFNLAAGVPGIELINGVDEYFVYSVPHIFPKLTNSYYLINDFISFSVRDIEIQAGAKFKVEEGYALFVNDINFIAEGTASDPIIFEGTSNVQGHWNGIAVNKSSGTFKMKDCRISNAGRGFLPSYQGSSTFATQKANIAFFTVNMVGASFFQNTLLSNSAGYGIWINSGVSSLDGTYLNNNQISYDNNLLGDFFK